MASSIIEIVPLTHLDNLPIDSGKPGPVTQRLMSAYKELIAKQTHTQI